MKYTQEEIDIMQAKIIEILKEKGEMRFGKIAKVLIHAGMAESSFVVLTILQGGCKDHKDFKGEDLFTSPKTGVWRLSESN
ncbi:hypothetical protein [Faecalimicrobium dakarense]|uniref:hypothetical protein n=1 Tax=Faecalimicrobium dakarense TaxID=1301100 RepID=UPI0004B146C4|nr:hypothetical protein [[Clostridium] dakarense]